MNVGVFTHMGAKMNESMYDKIQKIHDLGFHSCQINTLMYYKGRCDFADDFYTQERVDQINAACRDFDYKVSALFAGWSGYRRFTYPECYWSIGFVPSDLRQRRITDVLNGADFADRIGVKNVITHIGYLRDDPCDSERKSIVLGLRTLRTV